LCNACKYSVAVAAKEGTSGAKTAATAKFFDLFTESVRSVNPRQMQLSEELSKKCDLKIPGLNRVKWWIHEKCKLYDSGRSNANNNSNNTVNVAGSSSSSKNSVSKQQLSLYGSQSSQSSSQCSQSLPLYEQATNLIQDYRAKKNASEQSNEPQGNICFTCRK
jgi:hypothetical protein